MMHGYGEFTYPDGIKYQGEFENGKQKGVGMYKYPDGTHYKSDWDYRCY
jgi:hypothetical protein